MGSSLTYYEQKNHIGACEQLHNDSALVGALGQYGSKFYPSAKVMTDN